jgi:hypothetical protein
MARTVLLICLIAATAVFTYAADPKGPSMKKWKEGQAAKADAKAAEGAKSAKMAAVDKVITMMEDLQSQVLAEGEAEAVTYNKFACFCKTTQKEKSEAIKTGKDDKTSLTADIEKLSKERDDLDKKISGLSKDIKKAEDEMEKATSESKAANAEYKKNEQDMKDALSALTNAIKVLKSSKSASLVQLQSIGQTVKQAALLADALGLGGEQAQKVATLFLQQASGDVPVEMEDYKFHSGSIIESLEKLLDDFRKEKADVDADETKRVKAYNLLIQDKTDYVKAKNVELKESKSTRDEKISDIGTSSQELTTTSATLLDDMQYLDELNTICSQKAQTWDQRSKVRAEELTALTQAIGILKSTVAEKTGAATIRFAQTHSVLRLADAVASSEAAMESIEAEAEDVEENSAPYGFLQKRSISSHTPEETARTLVLSLLKGKGTKLGSTLLTSLAARIAADPFAKIKKLIQELIERLLTEAANEASQKGWCDKAMADAKQKREYAADEVEGLNAKMAKLEALSSKLTEELSTLDAEIKELEKDQAAARSERKEESEENAATVKEAKAGQAAVEQAIDILDKFYKTKAKEEVKYSLAQGPLDDAPDAGFDNGEAYTGANAEAGGIIGMMEVIQSDFVRTIKETEKAEKTAEQDHLEFMTETGMSLAEKTTAVKEKKRLKDETDSKFSDAEDELDSEMKILQTSIKELLELKPACIDTGMSYKDRVAMREEEIAALKKALCILGAYAQYGPDGLADAC